MLFEVVLRQQKDGRSQSVYRDSKGLTQARDATRLAVKPVEKTNVPHLLYPVVPAILACRNEGRVYAMPVISITSLSNDPALIGISSSRSHATYRAVLAARRFSVSWVDEGSVVSVERLATIPPVDRDKLEAAGLSHTDGQTLGTPIPSDARAAIECSLESTATYGDHELLVARVEAASADEDFQGYWRLETYRPILYAGSPGGRFTTYPAGTH